MQGVYLLHFTKPLGKAQHYIGYSNNIPRRLYQHRHGWTTAYMRAIHKLGITFRIVRIWEGGTKDLEYQLKRWHNGPKLCPICTPATGTRRNHNQWIYRPRTEP